MSPDVWWAMINPCAVYCAEQRSARNFLIKLAYQIEDEPRNLLEKSSVMAEEDSQSLRKGEHKLTVGQIKEHLLGELFGEQEGAFLAARRTKVETFAAERTKVVVPTFGVRTSDSRYPLKLVSAGTKSSSDLLNPLNPVHTVPLAELLLVLRVNAGRRSHTSLVCFSSRPPPLIAVLAFLHATLCRLRNDGACGMSCHEY